MFENNFGDREHKPLISKFNLLLFKHFDLELYLKLTKIKLKLIFRVLLRVPIEAKKRARTHTKAVFSELHWIFLVKGDNSKSLASSRNLENSR